MYGLRRYRCRILVFPRKVMEVLNPALDAEQAMQARVCATSKFQARGVAQLRRLVTEWSTAQDKSGHDGETSAIRHRERSQRYHKTVLS